MEEKLNEEFDRRFIGYPGGVWNRKTGKPALAEEIKKFIVREFKKLNGVEVGTEEDRADSNELLENEDTL